MSTHIEIPESLYTRLQKHAIPFVDHTPVSVIERWADHFDAQLNGRVDGKVAEAATAEYGTKTLNAMRPPDLFHTRVRGTFGSAPFSNWNDLVRIAHTEAFAKAKSFEELRTVSHAQVRKGNHSDSGYRFVPEIGISIQGVDANHAWTYSLQLAKYLQVPLRALIEWRHNAKAAHPGEAGLLEFVPPTGTM
jgi:hypothetical protein